MTAVLIAVLQVIACLGFGAAGLRLLRVGAGLPPGERHILSFTLGMGLIGWLVFFIGTARFLDPAALALLIGCGAMAAVICRSDLAFRSERPVGLVAILIVLGLGFTGLMDLFEALTPPGDADTLAYHFALPKQFLTTGQIDFVPRALDGAVPLLVQMTYLPVLSLGGETALMLWVFASGWMAVYAVYVLARRHLKQSWSLIVALVFATTPAVVYGAGSGQVEIRNALFVVSAILALTARGSEKATTYVLLAGLFAGFFVGGKYLGLLFAGACGLAVIWEKRRLNDGVIFSLGALLAGSQWYIWNALHVGDPVFPALFEWLGDPGTPFWSSEHQSYLRDVYIPGFQKIPSDLFWLFAFPFKATLFGEQVLSSGRTGLGPVILLLLPFAFGSAWLFRRSIQRGPLLTYALILFCFYVVWFFSGTPQLVRFLLPVYPFLLVLFFSATARLLTCYPLAERPLFLALFFTISVQIGGQALYSLKAAKYVFGPETRVDFLLRTVGDFQPVPWINENLAEDSKVLSIVRYYLYYFDVPYFYAHQSQQAQINLLPDADDLGIFIHQVRSLGISHVLLPDFNPKASASYNTLGALALANDCLIPVKTFSTLGVSSRTLASYAQTRSTFVLYQVSQPDCPGTPKDS
jgi:hypothetical protein